MVEKPPPAAQPRAVTPGKRRLGIRRFFYRYGWRTVAVPVLVALTVLVIFQVGQKSGSADGIGGPVGSSAATWPATVTVASPAVTTVVQSGTVTTVLGSSGAGGAAPPTESGLPGPDPNGRYTNMSSGALPGGAAFTAQGKGTWHVVPGAGGPIGQGAVKFTYTISVEDGIESAQADQEFASAVDATLADPRSWIGSGKYTLQRIASGTPSFTISLTSQLTERNDDMCGWQVKLEASCYARDHHRVSINNARWTRGAVSYNGDLGLYRIYAINHEVGHALGYGHQPCGVAGGLAPVMMQQSWSTANNDLSPLNPQLIPRDGKVCKPNPYPYPRTTVSASGAATASAGLAVGTAGLAVGTAGLAVGTAGLAVGTAGTTGSSETPGAHG